MSPVELTRECLARIARLNPVLNAYVVVTREAALEQASAAEQEIFNSNWRGPIHGIPIGLKDIIDTAGIATTAASNLFRNRIPMKDAPIVTALKNAGAVLLGKQNLHEFAYGGSSMISCFGEVRNAWNPMHIAGGSSGGSATAVAAGLGLAAIGTDTAGSIREPASQCGVVGLKPTYARVSATGVIPLSTSLDHVGPITTCVADAAILMDIITDASAPGEPLTKRESFSAALKLDARKLRLGIPRRFFFEGLDPEVESAVEEAIALLGKLTATMRDIELLVSTDRTLQSAESYAYHKDWASRTPELYQPETLRRILSGAKVSQAEYERSRRELDAARKKIQSTFKDVDLLITPTIPVPPPTIAELKQHPDQLRARELVLLRNTRPWNVWGVPTISIPCGFTRSGLPIGIQIAGAPYREDLVLSLAHAYEQVTDWHRHQPQIMAS